MNSLDQLKVQQELRGGARCSPEYQWTQGELNEAWRRITTPILALAEILANTRTVEEAAAWRAVPPELSEFADLAPEKLLEFSQQLRAAWAELDALARENKKIVRGPVLEMLQKWWTAYPLKNGPHWNVYFQTGTFFPTPKNYRALIARVCFDNRDFLGLCQNPFCKRYFIKPRRSSKFCKNCYAYDNSNRQKKHREKLHAQQGRKRVSK